MSFTSKRDDNYVPAIFGVSSIDKKTPTAIKVNPATGAMLVDSQSVFLGVFYNVKSYGAKGDGTTDDKTAIDAAIAAARAAGGGVVYFPQATYLTSGNHLIYSNIIYELNGSIINLKNSSNVDIFITYQFSINTGTNNTNDPADWQMRNGFLNGNASNQSAGDGIKIYGHNFVLQNIFITNCFSDGIYSEWSSMGTLTAPTNNMESMLINVKSSSNGGWGINWHGPHDSILTNVDAYNNTTGQFNFQANGDGTRCYNCHEYLNTTVGVQMGIRTVEWINSTAEVTTPGVAIKMLANENRVVGGIVIAPSADASTGIQIGDGTHAPVDCLIDTAIQTCNTAAVNFSGSGGYNHINIKVFQQSGTIVTGTPVSTDNVSIKSGSQMFGIPPGNIPQTNSSLIRMQLPDPSGTSGWYKLGTWSASNGAGGGARLRMQIIGAGGYNADAASAGRTVITLATGNGTPTPNIQGVWYTENGSALLDNVKAKKGADVNTWDIYVHLLSVFTGDAFFQVDTGTEKYPSTFIYSLVTGSDPGSASATVAILTQRFQIESAAIMDQGLTVNNNLTANGSQQTFNSYTQINGAIDVLGGNMRVDNSANSVGAGVFVGKSDGNQYTNFILADNVYPLDANPGGHYWAFSNRTDRSFLIFNYNGAGVYTNTIRFLEDGSVKFIGKATQYNNIATTGWGVPAIYGQGRSTAQTGAVASVATYTVGASDGSFLVSANANITTFVAGTFNVTASYTDETNTAQTLKLNFSTLTGTLGISLAASGPFEGIPAHIRCKAGTTITVATSGTFTSLTYNVEAVIQQLA